MEQDKEVRNSTESILNSKSRFSCDWDKYSSVPLSSDACKMSRQLQDKIGLAKGTESKIIFYYFKTLYKDVLLHNSLTDFCQISSSSVY